MSLNSYSNGKRTGRGKEKSNLDNKVSNDLPPSREKAQQNRFAIEKASYVAHSTHKTDSQKEILFKGLTEKQVRAEIWIIEGEDNFLERGIRSQLSRIAKYGDRLFKEWIVDRGCSNNCPESWEEFKPQIINYCIGKTLEMIEKYSEESWSDYIIRLKDAAKRNGLAEENVIKKLKTMRVPERYQILLQGDLFDTNQMIKKLIEWEDIRKVETRISDYGIRSNVMQNINKKENETKNYKNYQRSSDVMNE